MKLLNHTLKYLSITLFVIISVWAAIFYINMLDEVYDSLDDGLDNYKLLIIKKAQEDSTILTRNEFAESNYEIREIPETLALPQKDIHMDTLMYMLNEEDFEPVRMLTSAFRLNNRYYELKVISSMVEEDDLIEDLFYSLIWLYVALITSIIIVNNFLLKKTWKPFYLLLEQLKQFKLGKDPVITPAETEVKEFKELNEAVGLLINRSLEAYNGQKHFIENASHELQTPLAISINKLELLAEKEDQTETNLIAIGQVIQTLERLTKLNKSLLLLSKIENKQFQDNEQVNINSVFKTIIEEFTDFADYKNVSFSFRENGQLLVEMNKNLAEILITNFIKNAIVHNIPNGFVRIIINPSSFTIHNSGSEVPLNQEYIFKRFHKKTNEKNSTGLGLAIVKAIANLYDLSIGYSYENGHQMTVSFK
ncbi:sensor histidine kinase [Dyadobacter frigoris]|uniref:histidine kinase n=1 Tax=Dyadobacter frigoris TaxID=2576211 RepID=A0A4U6D826_9BACT|nr:HAMP domain-containing sensor histidine kinase [Dyadobacter frigoris]TKT90284.1 HAMP domain-containing histidine kinase [Dyadobacter frigoris]GLU52519.1 two-component sensor histidine kinase [Dyadobacter frigoris]